jgi:menaquinone-dependent protoporphyrinogen oxidase
MSNSNSITRRSFLQVAGVTIGGTVLACSGLTFVATREPAIELTQNTFGGNSTMNNKILVAYASKSGSTVQIAETIGKSLSDKGATVDVRPIKMVTSLDGYRAVVIGSGIRMGSWLPEAVDFVKKNQAKLSQVPTAFFSVHLQNLDDAAESRTKREAYTAPVRQIVNPKVEGFFAGKMEFAKLSFLESLISKALNAKEQDLRDWNKIRAWAENAYPTLAVA